LARLAEAGQPMKKTYTIKSRCLFHAAVPDQLVGRSRAQERIRRAPCSSNAASDHGGQREGSKRRLPRGSGKGSKRRLRPMAGIRAGAAHRCAAADARLVGDINVAWRAPAARARRPSSHAHLSSARLRERPKCPNISPRGSRPTHSRRWPPDLPSALLRFEVVRGGKP
jgi:hypothetical protein